MTLKNVLLGLGQPFCLRTSERGMAVMLWVASVQLSVTSEELSPDKLLAQSRAVRVDDGFVSS